MKMNFYEQFLHEYTIQLLKQFLKEKSQQAKQQIAKQINDNNKYLYINKSRALAK